MREKLPIVGERLLGKEVLIGKVRFNRVTFLVGDQGEKCLIYPDAQQIGGEIRGFKIEENLVRGEAVMIDAGKRMRVLGIMTASGTDIIFPVIAIKAAERKAEIKKDDPGFGFKLPLARN